MLRLWDLVFEFMTVSCLRGFGNFTAACEPMVVSTVLSPLKQRLRQTHREILREILGSGESCVACDPLPAGTHPAGLKSIRSCPLGEGGMGWCTWPPTSRYPASGARSRS